MHEAKEVLAMAQINYSRLTRPGIDPALRTFLITVTDEAIQRRAMVAFPEYYSERVRSPVPVALADYVLRMSVSEYSGEEECEAVKYFGNEIVTFETFAEIADPGDALVLPDNFPIMREPDYQGFTTTDRWWLTNGDERYLVLSVIPKERGVLLRTISERAVLLE